MPRSLKISALLTCLLAVLFYLFFQTSKHNPALAPLNVFGEDPYDAVGSFGIQFTAFAALITAVRAFRPYHASRDANGQEILLVHGAYLACLSVAVTLLADIVALLRYPTVWSGKPAGNVLAALTVGMALFTALVSWYIHHAARAVSFTVTKKRWLKVIGIAAVSSLIIACYPTYLHQGIAGVLFTAIVGMVFFWLLVWVAGIALAPATRLFFEDCIDDFVAIYDWLKVHTGRLSGCYHFLEMIVAWPWMHFLVRWLNPRRHRWNLIIVLALVVGFGLGLLEVLGEGFDPQQIGRVSMVIAVFVGLECLGVALGYAFLARPMGLFRNISQDKMR